MGKPVSDPNSSWLSQTALTLLQHYRHPSTINANNLRHSPHPSAQYHTSLSDLIPLHPPHPARVQTSSTPAPSRQPPTSAKIFALVALMWYNLIET